MVSGQVQAELELVREEQARLLAISHAKISQAGHAQGATLTKRYRKVGLFGTLFFVFWYFFVTPIFNSGKFGFLKGVDLASFLLRSCPNYQLGHVN